MAVCGVRGRRIKSSFNFNCNFFQRHCAVVQSQKRCMIFSPKELQNEQDDVAVKTSKRFSFRKEYCLVPYIEKIFNTCWW